MPTSNKMNYSKKTKKVVKSPTKKTSKTLTQKTMPLGVVARMKYRLNDYLSRRPHRSFRRTRRRDYVRTLVLPSQVAFTRIVVRQLWIQRRVFLKLVGIYIIVSIVFVGLGSQDTFKQLADVLRQTSGNIFHGAWGQFGQAGLLFVTTVNGTLSGQITETQQLYGGTLFLLVWLTTVWLLRAQLANQKPRLRDALYNAGAPIIPTLLIALLCIVQFLPGAIGILIYSVLSSAGFLANGAVAIIVCVIVGLLFVMTLYFLTSTLLALVVVTLPGMYPWQAVRTAGDLVIGRRFRILLRLLWMVGLVAIAWIVIMIPIILLVTLIQTSFAFTAGFPVVPIVLVLMTCLTTVFVATYIYMLYRKIVEDDAKPA